MGQLFDPLLNVKVCLKRNGHSLISMVILIDRDRISLTNQEKLHDLYLRLLCCLGCLATFPKLKMGLCVCLLAKEDLVKYISAIK